MTRRGEHIPGGVTPHPAGRRGRLTTPDGAQLPVRTFERGPNVALVVLVDLPEQTATDRLEPALLEYNSARGVVRLRGEAVFEDRSLIRFEAATEPEVTQRREFVRIHSPRPVVLKAEQEVIDDHAHTIDLSGGGMLVSGADTLAVDDEVRFSMQLGPRELLVAGVARVVRVHDDGQRALSFIEIDEGDRDRLIRYVFECMRTARAKTRGDWF